MTTAIGKKTPVEIKWPLAKVQEKTARVLADNMLAVQSVLAKYGPEALEQYDKQILANKVEYYRGIGVKTPIDLVRAMGEFEGNLFGSKIEIWGDDKQASLTYDSCAIFNAMKPKLSPEMEEKIGGYFERCVGNLAREFGFQGEVKFEDPGATVTFTRK